MYVYHPLHLDRFELLLLPNRSLHVISIGMAAKAKDNLFSLSSHSFSINIMILASKKQMILTKMGNSREEEGQ